MADDQLAAAIMAFACKVHLGSGRAALGFGLADQGVLQPGFGIDIAQARLRRTDIGLGLGLVRAVVFVIDAKQHVPGVHALVIPDLYHSDVAGHLGGERGDVAAHIGIVGRGAAVAECHRPAACHQCHGAQAEQHANQLFPVAPRPGATGFGAGIGGHGGLVLARVHVLCPV
ncbi:hypothetical protein D9M71_197600 [compost metagenome]